MSRETDPISAGAPSAVDASKELTSAIAISATFTPEALEPTLACWLRKLKLEFPIRFASYNQVFQQLLDPAGLFAANRNGLNVVSRSGKYSGAGRKRPASGVRRALGGRDSRLADSGLHLPRISGISAGPGPRAIRRPS
jgi:hypothetical protein